MKKEDENKDEAFNSYLTFQLGDEHFGVDVMKVIEILEVPKITAVPRAPEYLKGVINLRGNVLPVLDTRIKFMLSPTEMKVSTCVVVLEILIEDEVVILGALVDAVNEVIDLQDKDIKPSPSIGSNYNPEFINGVAHINDQFIMLLSIGKVFSIEDVKMFADTTTVEADK